MRIRPYDHEFDFVSVLRLLSEWYVADGHLPNWHPYRWSYMHHHPNVDEIDVSLFGLAVDDTGIVGIVHQEHARAFAYLQMASERVDAIAPLVDWAEHRLGGWSKTLERDALGFWIGRCQASQVDEVQRREYELTDFTEPTTRLDLTDPVEPTPLPDGYRLATLADDNDLRKVNQVLWRGFGHGDDPPDDEIPGRARGQRAPGFRHDRTVVVAAPNGDFVSYAGIWFDERNRSAYVEPVATDPDHRRLGLGRAAVLETLRLVREDGASHAWVGSDQEFYFSMGFRTSCTADLWLRPS